jgi:hypothetical protein
MITLSHEQLDKINLLDKIFASMDVEQLKQIAESEQIVSRLKGFEDNPQIILNLVHEYDTMKLDLMNAKAELVGLKSDFQALLKVLHSDVFTPRYNMEFNNLKNKYGVY